MVILLNRLTDGLRFADRNHFSREPRSKVEVDVWTAHEDGGELPENSENKVFESDLFVDKRNSRQSESPCSCPSKPKIVNFGPGSYPRRHLSYVCDENMSASKNACSSGRCKEVLHNIYVLKFRPSDKLVEQDAHKLPNAIKKDFYLAVEVSKSLRQL